jgi:hypothetical protein
LGISIYYTARRSSGLSDQEQSCIDEIVSRYSIKDRIDAYGTTGGEWLGEDFCLYDLPLDSADVILEGATGLPDGSEDALRAAVQHLCRALSEIRRALPNAQWRVQIDDHDIRWDEEREEFDPST